MRHLRSFFCQAVFAVACLLCSVGARAQEPQTQLPRVTLNAGDKRTQDLKISGGGLPAAGGSPSR